MGAAAPRTGSGLGAGLGAAARVGDGVVGLGATSARENDVCKMTVINNSLRELANIQSTTPPLTLMIVTKSGVTVPIDLIPPARFTFLKHLLCKGGLNDSPRVCGECCKGATVHSRDARICPPGR